MPKVVHVMGPPGSGKGTQANLIADYLYAIHFDTGRFLERMIKESDPLVTSEFKRQFDVGLLNTPEIVLKLVKKHTKKLAGAGFSVVFSGSPRSLYEAFGRGKIKGLMEFLVNLYGKKNITIFKLNIPEKESIKRNSTRLVCSTCKKGSINPSIKRCSICGGALYRRTLDKPDVIKIRLKEYKEQTKPIFAGLKKAKFRVIEIDGTQKPAEVFKDIKKYL